MFLKILAAFTVAITALLPFTEKAQAQTQNSIQPPTELPDSLPIGDRQRMLDWVVTNSSCGTASQITYNINMSGPVHLEGQVTSTTRQWDSYASFNSYIASNAFAMFTKYRDRMNPSYGVIFSPYVVDTSHGAIPVLETLDATTNVGPVSTITSNSFASIRPDYFWVVVRVPGLQFFSVETSGYSFRWSPTGATQSPPYPISPDEGTRTDIVMLNEWYSLATNRVRFAIAVAGVTNRYTEYGDCIRTSLSMKSKTELEAHVARGSDTCIVSSTNLVNWTIVTNILSAKTNVLFLPIDQTKRMLYFKVASSS